MRCAWAEFKELFPPILIAGGEFLSYKRKDIQSLKAY